MNKNFSYSLVAAISGNSLTVTSGQGVLFPVPPFNATVWPTGVIPLNENAEIVTVTAIEGNVFTIIRAQEGTTEKPIAAGYQIAATITAKIINDIEAGVAANASAIQTTNQGLSTLGEIVETLGEDVVAIEARVATNEQNISSTNSALNTLSTEVETLEETVEAKIEIVPNYAAISVSNFKRFIFVTSDEQNNGDGSLYLHTGTELKFLLTAP